MMGEVEVGGLQGKLLRLEKEGTDTDNIKLNGSSGEIRF